ncbi:hypothetical protein V5O48_007132 [Marasmius crinis-equi]|uniref:HMG box domain-containing protein n=1 Tax=Marasmius crinis-equi TaxID=585013 RepID=A0ABR3FHZ9_9AGAR
MSSTDQVKIPRPRNPWIIFLSEHCQLVNQQNGKGRASGERQSAVASRLWRSLSEKERAVYERKARIEEQEHREKYPGYVYKPARPGTKKTGNRPSKMGMVKEAQRSGSVSSPSDIGWDSASLQSDSMIYLSPPPDVAYAMALQQPSGPQSQPTAESFQSSSSTFVTTISSIDGSRELYQGINNAENAPIHLPSTITVPTSLPNSVPPCYANATRFQMTDRNIKDRAKSRQDVTTETETEQVLQKASNPNVQLNETQRMSQVTSHCGIEIVPQNLCTKTLELSDGPPAGLTFPSLAELKLNPNTLDVPPSPNAELHSSVNEAPFDFSEWLVDP